MLLQETVIHASNCLAVRALKLVKGFHTNRTSEFVKACVTFNEITIPSLSSVVIRANLFLETAEVDPRGLQKLSDLSTRSLGLTRDPECRLLC